MAKILLVEDEPSIRDLYTRQLTKASHSVVAVEDGTKGLEQLKTASFDILLLDIMLPGINGLQVLREFKTFAPNSPTKVILLTNLGQDSVIKEGFDLGAQAYLIKASYTPDQVVAEVQNILSGQPSNLPNTAPTPGSTGTTK